MVDVQAEITRYAVPRSLASHIRQAFAIWLQIKIVLSFKGFSLNRILHNLPKIIPVLFSGQSLPQIVRKCVSIIRHKKRRVHRKRWAM